MMTEAEKKIEVLAEKHSDVVMPVINRINELTRAGDADGLLYIHEAAAQLALAIEELLAKGKIICHDAKLNG